LFLNSIIYVKLFYVGLRYISHTDREARAREAEVGHGVQGHPEVDRPVHEPAAAEHRGVGRR